MIDFLLPSLGADMDRAMLVSWLVQPGDPVRSGQVIAELETDKGIIEVECWHDGVVAELLAQPGPAKLAVGTPLARIEAAGAAAQAALADRDRDMATAPPGKDVRPAPGKVPGPPIRHLAHVLGVDLTGLEGTGSDGAVTRDDVRRAASQPRPAPAVVAPAQTREPGRGGRPMASPRARWAAGQLGVDLGAVPAVRSDGMITEDDVRARVGTPIQDDRVRAMRSAIARSMSHSKREIPHYYLATQIDLDRSMRWLEEANADRSISERLLPAVLLLKATALAVREVPELNGHWIADAFRPAESVQLGVAVSLREGGLVAPAIHDADQLDLGKMMLSLRDLVTRARSWRLRSSEMSDPTITVTNLGDRGVEMAFPVIIPPQVAMVGFGKVAEEVVAVEGSPAVHYVVHASLAGDHRVTDGHRGGLFLAAIDQLLQEPESL